MHLTSWESCLLVWKMGTVPVAYGKHFAQCLFLVHSKYWPSFPRGWRD